MNKKLNNIGSDIYEYARHEYMSFVFTRNVNRLQDLTEER